LLYSTPKKRLCATDHAVNPHNIDRDSPHGLPFAVVRIPIVSVLLPERLTADSRQPHLPLRHPFIGLLRSAIQKQLRTRATARFCSLHLAYLTLIYNIISFSAAKVKFFSGITVFSPNPTISERNFCFQLYQKTLTATGKNSYNKYRKFIFNQYLKVR
jgi:hypothetical protein